MPPLLVVVSGLPGAGKSTLSKRLAGDLGLVLVSRDRLKPPLAEMMAALPADGWNPLLGAALDRIMNEILGALLDAGVGAVVDGNFNWVQQRDAVRTLVEERGPPCFEICLWGDVDTLRRRFIERNDPPLTEDLALQLEAALSRPREAVLGPPTPTVELDSTDLGALEEAHPMLIADIRQMLLSSTNESN